MHQTTTLEDHDTVILDRRFQTVEHRHYRHIWKSLAHYLRNLPFRVDIEAGSL